MKLNLIRVVRRFPQPPGSRLPRERRVRGGPDGFTLIELMVVVVILAVAAAIVVPMASSGATMQLRSAVNMLAADLEYAKSLSIGTGRSYTVEFTVANDTYRLCDDGLDTIQHPVTKKDYVMNFRMDRRLGQVTIASVAFDGHTRVCFDYLGIPYHGGFGELLNPGVVTLSAGGVNRSVRVEPVTGFISVLD